MAEELKPETPPTETPAAPETPVVETPPVSKLVERVTNLGFKDVKSDDEAFDRLASAFEQQGEQFRGQLKEIREEMLASAPVEPEADEPVQQRWWNPPQADLTVAGRYRNTDGSWKPETPGDVRRQVEELEAYRDNFARKLVADPETALAPLLEQKFNQFFEQKFGQLTAQQQYQRELDANPWLWEKDPTSGQPTQKLTQEGVRLDSLMKEFANDILSSTGKMPDQAMQFRYGMKILKAEKAASAATRLSPEQAAEKNAEKKAGLLGQAAPTTNRAGSMSAPGKETVRNRNLTFGQKVAQRAAAGA